MIRYSHYPLPAPDVHECEIIQNARVLALEALVRMKLTSFRDRDRVHLRDMLEVGLIDETWPDRFTQDLQPRLLQIIRTPDG